MKSRRLDNSEKNIQQADGCSDAGYKYCSAGIRRRMHIILLNGENVFSMESIDVRRRVGMVFQRPTPFPTMSIYNNVLSGFTLNGIRLSKIEKDAIK